MLPPPERVTVIIPALNEEAAIGRVIHDIPAGCATEIVVVDNGSTDATVEVARQAGARVVHEPQRGYGAACLKGIEQAACPDIIAFIDGDFSDYPGDLALLLAPIRAGDADFVIGSRMAGPDAKRVLPPQAFWGNKLATVVLKFLTGYRFTDLGPFRAIRATALRQLCMRDRNYGWTIEMQIKALRHGLRILEIPVRYRERIGQSKISGTVQGSIKAGLKILYTIFKYCRPGSF